MFENIYFKVIRGEIFENFKNYQENYIKEIAKKIKEKK